MAEHIREVVDAEIHRQYWKAVSAVYHHKGLLLKEAWDRGDESLREKYDDMFKFVEKYTLDRVVIPDLMNFIMYKKNGDVLLVSKDGSAISLN